MGDRVAVKIAYATLALATVFVGVSGSAGRARYDRVGHCEPGGQPWGKRNVVPTGLSLTYDRVLSGASTAVGKFRFTVTATPKDKTRRGATP
jgi:hypothetical protein